MSAVDEIYDAREFLDSELKQFAYMAPEVIGPDGLKGLALVQAQREILHSAWEDGGGSHDEPNAFRLALDLARAINGMAS